MSYLWRSEIRVRSLLISFQANAEDDNGAPQELTNY